MPRQKPSCFDEALNILSRRAHAVKDLAGKLKKKEYEGYVIAETIDKLIEKKFLDDAAYALSRAKYRATSSKWGAGRIKQELSQHGVAEHHVKAALSELEEPEDSMWDEAHDFLQTATDLLSRKYREPPTTPQDTKKRMDFLLRRGFSYDQVKKALDALKYPTET